MAKTTKALSGPAKRKYIRDVLAAERGISAEAAKRLTDRFDSDISQMRVRQHAALRAAMAAKMPARQAAAEPPAEPVAVPPQTPPPMFDPHAFSLIVVLTKQGADGLMGRLLAIEDIDHLRELARAQHIAVDAALADAAAVRAAIVTGTEQRIANRRAAAS